jgi:hypothetical protein
MKILCITENLGSGGAERQLCGLAIELKKKGYDVKVVTYLENQFYQPLLESSGVNYDFLPNLWSKWTRVWRMAKLVKREVIEDCFAYTYMSNDPGGEYINYLSGAGWTMGEIKVDYEYGTTGVPLTNGDKSMFIMTFAAKTSEGYEVLVLFEKKQFNN